MRLGDLRRILLLNRNHIGDCLLTTPLVRALKRRFPRAHLSVAIPASNRDLLATNSHIDEILERPAIQNWGAKLQFAQHLRSREYDLIVAVQEKSMFYAWATLYASLGRRDRTCTVALDHPRTRLFYQHTVTPVRPDQHEVHKYLDVADALGCPRERNPVLELEPTRNARERVEWLLSGHAYDPDARFIGINPGGTKQEKRWPVERFAEVADRLHRELELPVVILGSPDDLERAYGISERMTHRPLVVTGRTSLGDTAAMLERCQLLVTGDTGPMHMAVALAVPVVALYGPTRPVKYGPFTSLRTVLRHDDPCGTCALPCLHTISADECVAAALRLYTAPPVPKARVDRR